MIGHTGDVASTMRHLLRRMSIILQTEIPVYVVSTFGCVAARTGCPDDCGD